VTLGFADAGMQEGKSENEKKKKQRGPLYIYNGKKCGQHGPLNVA
jgi:hypothetical protein